MSLRLLKPHTVQFDAEELFIAYYERVFEWSLHLTGHDHMRRSSFCGQKTLNLSSIFKFPFCFKFHRTQISQT